MPKILNQKSIFKSKLFDIKQADIEFNGITVKYEIISGTGRGAVMVVPFIENAPGARAVRAGDEERQLLKGDDAVAQ